MAGMAPHDRAIVRNLNYFSLFFSCVFSRARAHAVLTRRCACATTVMPQWPRVPRFVLSRSIVEAGMGIEKRVPGFPDFFRCEHRQNLGENRQKTAENRQKSGRKASEKVEKRRKTDEKR